MRLVVGLGNPGGRYEDSPHNAGFWICDRLCERNPLGAEAKKFKGLFRRGRIAGQDVGVLKPQTYMNLSGESVAEALRYLPVELSDLLVVYDEMDLPVGRLRLRPHGGHGGHNGMRSIIECIGSRDFPRIRLGVGRPPGKASATQHLLSRVRAEQREQLTDAVQRAVEATEAILGQGIQAAMNRFNAAPATELEEETS